MRTCKPLLLRCCFACGVVAAWAVLTMPAGHTHGQIAATEFKEMTRQYSAGPLKADDFQAALPDPLPARDGITMVAFTAATTRYKFRYECRPSGKRFIAHATEVKLDCVLDQDKSWLARPADADLLRHEQGHFDIAEWNTRLTQRHFDKLMQQGKPRAAARTEAAAIASLKEMIKEEFERLRADGLAEQARYDKETRFGLDPTAQHQWERMLEEKLSFIEPSGPP